jgi:hypothetical protein
LRTMRCRRFFCVGSETVGMAASVVSTSELGAGGSDVGDASSEDGAHALAAVGEGGAATGAAGGESEGGGGVGD